MSDRIVTVQINIPDDTGDDLDGISFSIESDGIVLDSVPPLILAAAEITIRTRLQQEMATENPYATGDVLSAMSTLNARLAAVDMIMHLPMAVGAVNMAAIEIPRD